MMSRHQRKTSRKPATKIAHLRKKNGEGQGAEEDGQEEVSGAAAMNLRPILQAILEGYTLPVNGYHGVSHWARVLENGLRLCEETGANVEVVSLFAVFHDSKRVNESIDPDHGQRGADFAAEHRGQLFVFLVGGIQTTESAHRR